MKNKFYAMKDAIIVIFAGIGVLICLIVGFCLIGINDNKDNTVINKNKDIINCGWVFGEGIKCGVVF